MYSFYCGGEHISRAGTSNRSKDKIITLKEGIFNIDNRNRIIEANSLYPTVVEGWGVFREPPGDLRLPMDWKEIGGDSVLEGHS
jgi:hypothetical protein